MNPENICPAGPSPESASGVIKIIGVGTAGAAMIERMAGENYSGAKLFVVNPDAISPVSPAIEIVHLEARTMRGLGCGGDPEHGRKLAEEHFARLKEICAGAQQVFILAGLGGGAGTGIAPVLSRAARESGALVLAFVTLPFECEGNRRLEQARYGLEQIRTAADGVMCLPNQSIFKLIDENSSVLDAFRTTAGLLLEAVRGVWRLLRHRGLIEIHVEELCVLLRARHAGSCFATVDAAGTTRAHDAVEKLFAHPLLDGGRALKEADTLLISMMGGPDLSMAHVNHFMQRINQEAQQAKIMMGAAVDESFRDRLAVTVIVLKHADTPRATKPAKAEPTEDNLPEFDAEMLHKKPVERPASRTVPPAPVLTMEQRAAVLAKSGVKGGRVRKTGPRMKQTTLPLEIVNKGRFDKTEATIRNGEDLDVPTYIRKGVALN